MAAACSGLSTNNNINAILEIGFFTVRQLPTSLEEGDHVQQFLPGQ